MWCDVSEKSAVSTINVAENARTCYHRNVGRSYSGLHDVMPHKTMFFTIVTTATVQGNMQ
jgi:hypothetical protein